ncbi:MAG: acetate kinase [Firmicutes bacterium]|nr:acetate kinase [Bacillota bacterium]
MKILVLNCGSSSVKYKLFEMESAKVLAQGLAERIGMPGSCLKHKPAGKPEVLLDQILPGHSETVENILELLTCQKHGVINSIQEITAVGHRVVHGGEKFKGSVIVEDNIFKDLEKCNELAPLHNPSNIAGINVCKNLIPYASQVAVFDTAFHQTMPSYVYNYAIPYRYYSGYGLRKYGFHGISHKYVVQRSAKILGQNLTCLKGITCHLGNGASLCAVDAGKSVDTTMGFTPLAGLVMGTRSGDIDPAIVDFLAEKEGLSPSEVIEILNRESGVLGLSGVSSDFRDLESAARSGIKRAALALDMFVYSVSKNIGALVPTLGRLDALVFTAGIGENSPEIRFRICSSLNYLGIKIDEQKNDCRGMEIEISTSDSAVRVLVVPTDEEIMIANEVKSIIKDGQLSLAN